MSRVNSSTSATRVSSQQLLRPHLVQHDSVASNDSSSSFGSLFTFRNAHSNPTETADSVVESTTTTTQRGLSQSPGSDTFHPAAMSDESASSPSSSSVGASTSAMGMGMGHRRSSSTPTQNTILQPAPISISHAPSSSRPISGTSYQDTESLSGHRPASPSGSLSASPRRSSLRRKPVPSYILPNSGLPPSHPFAQATTPPHSRPGSVQSTSNSPARGSKYEAGLRPSSLLSQERTSPTSSRSSSPAHAPGGGRMGMTPPPPLRRPPGGPAVPPRNVSRGSPAPPKMASSKLDREDVGGGEDDEEELLDVERGGLRRTTFNGTLDEFMNHSLHTGSGSGEVEAITPTQSPRSHSQSRSVSLDRPLPPLPAEAAAQGEIEAALAPTMQAFGSGSGSGLGSGSNTPRRRSISAESSDLPLTPRKPTSSTPIDSPHVVISHYPPSSPTSDPVSSRTVSEKHGKTHLKPPKTSFFRRESDKSDKAKKSESRRKTDTASAHTNTAINGGGSGSGKGRARRTSLFAGYETEEESEFSVDRVPSKQRMWEASSCMLRDENGDLVSFGDFFPKYGGKPSPPAAFGGGPGLGARGGASGLTSPRGGQGRMKGKQRASPPALSPTGTETNTFGLMGALPTTPPLDDKQPVFPPSEAHAHTRPTAYSGPTPKTVIFFIRHFWCGQCQDYTFASLSLLDPVALEKAGIRVVIISNGSWKIIKAYRKLFNCPFPIYVDGPRRLYQLMGMTKMTNDFGPMFKGRATYHQRPVPTQLLHGLSNAFFRMPLANPGTLTQLGGEFILSPGWQCTFAHRMTTTSDHMEAPDVLRIAGCEFPTKSEVADIELAESQKQELERLEKEMESWRQGRHEEIERIRQKKAARRGEAYVPRRPSGLDDLDLNVDTGTTSMPEPAELDQRLDKVMRIEEDRVKSRIAAERLMVSREQGDLVVELEHEGEGTNRARHSHSAVVV